MTKKNQKRIQKTRNYRKQSRQKRSVRNKQKFTRKTIKGGDKRGEVFR